MVLYAYMCCVCVFSLHRESPDMILGDKPLISKVVLSQKCSSIFSDKDQVIHASHNNFRSCNDKMFMHILVDLQPFCNIMTYEYQLIHWQRSG
jgi:hypothetical protein